MKLIVVTTCDNLSNERYLKLVSSLERFGYHYECVFHPFTFGTQLNVIRKWAESYTGDATHMLYTDAFDTVAFGGPEEVVNNFEQMIINHACENGHFVVLPPLKMLISAEKNCYPHPERKGEYPETESAWKYVNGGGWIAEIEYFKYICSKENLNPGSHDQVWLMEAYLKNRDEIKLDTQCDIFQTIAFSHKEEWSEGDNRFYNLATGSCPVFFHGNGHTEMDWVYEILE